MTPEAELAWLDRNAEKYGRVTVLVTMPELSRIQVISRALQADEVLEREFLAAVKSILGKRLPPGPPFPTIDLRVERRV